MAIFNSYVKLPEGIEDIEDINHGNIMISLVAGGWSSIHYPMVMINIAMENP